MLAGYSQSITVPGYVTLRYYSGWSIAVFQSRSSIKGYLSYFSLRSDPVLRLKCATKLVLRPTSTNAKPYSVSKQGKVLQKLMHQPNKNKQKWYADKNSTIPNSFVKVEGRESHRRLAVLNTLFMEQITNLLSTGEHSEELLCYDVQISRVKVSIDFHSIHVFWFSRDEVNEEQIEKILKSVSGSLRHELAQLKLIGLVPKLVFMKDKAYNLMNRLDYVLKQADDGECKNHEPVLSLKNDTEFYTKLSPEVRKEIYQLEKKSCETLESIPIMRNDVYGIDHATIVKNIKQTLKNRHARTSERLAI
ncbi:uncharacterized protein LOC129728559 [Wyeomyia smithii]|uniref:uncharacterized protein LOC129728559 n=1 Tax=Wyeomyia smithii TaxID=174621 RepID=UPI002467E7BA|nr:uncharacterized protein LOC129728559 [Wyeomyia smithii]